MEGFLLMICIMNAAVFTCLFVHMSKISQVYAQQQTIIEATQSLQGLLNNIQARYDISKMVDELREDLKK